MRRFDRKTVSRFRLGGLWLLCWAGLAWGCQSGGGARTDFSPPPAEYQRRLLLVFENHDFRPLAGAPVAVEFLEGRALSGISGRTARDGSLALTVKPLMRLGAASIKDGDLFIDYRTRLKITLWPGQAGAVTFDWEDQQSYAYYQDPLYEGQTRRPWEGEEIINFTLNPPSSGPAVR